MKHEFKFYEFKGNEKAELIAKLEEILLNDDEIIFAYLYGSFIEEREFRDIDLAIWLKNPKKAFQYTVNISTKLQIKLNIPIDIHILNEAPLPFKYYVFTCGKLIHSKNEGFRIEIVNQTLRMYFDLKHLYENSK
ncbi:MAG: nucleotidyltransferase domain-containing protein [archaeon GB-1867-035]|nr:nucleotidyltransferase domain-containing protein [Candidatus Culexmicrobium profundum]